MGTTPTLSNQYHWETDVFAETVAESKSYAQKANVVSIGDPIADIGWVGSYLEERGILLLPCDTHATPENSADLILVNFNRLTSYAQQKVQKAKSEYRAPVVCLVSLEDAEKLGVLGALGAEDFIFKPFNLHELACRILVILSSHKQAGGVRTVERRRRARRRTDFARFCNILQPGQVKLQIDDQKKVIRIDDRSIQLTPKEYRLFCLLASDAGRIFSVAEIMASLWSDRRRVSESDVQQYIYLLRKKVERDFHQPKWIKTVKGFGYKLNIPVT